jgi:hypothetical protein
LPVTKLLLILSSSSFENLRLIAELTWFVSQ